MSRGTVMNTDTKTDMEENKMLNKVVFLDFMHTKSILVASWHYGWTTDVTWNILTLSLLPFWALNVSVGLLFMES